MGFFDDVKDFFGVGEAEEAETGLAEAGEKAGNGAAARANMGDVHTYVSNDIDVVRAQQDLQTAKSQLTTATQRRDQRQQKLQGDLQAAKRASYTFKQKPQLNGKVTDPNEAKIRDIESKLHIIKFDQYAEDVKSADRSVKNMQKKVSDAKRSARSRYRQAVGGR